VIELFYLLYVVDNPGRILNRRENHRCHSALTGIETRCMQNPSPTHLSLGIIKLKGVEKHNAEFSEKSLGEQSVFLNMDNAKRKITG